MPKYQKTNQFGCTTREQRFCETYVATGSRYTAVEVFKFKDKKDAARLAARLLKRDCNIQYIKYLQSQICEAIIVDKAKMISESIRLYEQLLSDGKISEAVKMFENIGKLTGAFENSNIQVDHIIKVSWNENLLSNNSVNNFLSDENEDNDYE